jgi:glycerol uptake facilitator-like aquaporin
MQMRKMPSYMAIILFMGKISGAYLNPAVSIAYESGKS